MKTNSQNTSQTKSGAASKKATPTAPPIFRPLPTPLVLQRKERVVPDAKTPRQPAGSQSKQVCARGNNSGQGQKVVQRAVSRAAVRLFRRGERVNFIKIKRIQMLRHADEYGHWWVEVDGKESFGWWPKEGVSKTETVSGVPGELNRGGSRDPHHGDKADVEFHPMVAEDVTEDEIRHRLKDFALSYGGDWQWAVGYGQNCHSFQRELMSKVGLVNERDPVGAFANKRGQCVIL